MELAMQLCSQEWLTALERHAGVSFTKLLREGRHVASSTDEVGHVNYNFYESCLGFFFGILLFLGPDSRPYFEFHNHD